MDISGIVKHEAVGNITNLAKICRVSKQCVSKWKKLPPGRCKFVHDATGIDYEDLRPDIQWSYNEMTSKYVGWFTPFESFESCTRDGEAGSPLSGGA